MTEPNVDHDFQENPHMARLLLDVAATRRLVMAACSIDHCMVYYERGGIAHTWQVTLFHWTPAATRFEWGGIAPGGLRTIDDLRKAVLSGAIRASSSW